MKIGEPLVTVNILSYNRCDELRNTLRRVFEQGYKNIEVIVVDNASSDGTCDMVENEFPGARLMRLRKNVGIAGWNEGFRNATGEYILVLDDDSYPVHGTIRQALESIDGNPDWGVLALDVYNMNWDKWETSMYRLENNLSFVGCGALVRKAIFPITGMFEELLFVYSHEIEFSMRVRNAGYKIPFASGAVIVHMHSMRNRELKGKFMIDARKHYYFVRNNLIILYLHFPFYRVVLRSVRYIAGSLLFALTRSTFLGVCRGLASFVLFLPYVVRKRTVLTDAVQREYGYGSALASFFSDGKYGFLRPRILKR